MRNPYQRSELDDLHRRWIGERIQSGGHVCNASVELAAISDEFSIDLTALERDYESSLSSLRVKYRARDVSPTVFDMSEETAKRQLIELVGTARKLATLCEVLMLVAIRRADKTRRATAAKGAQGRLTGDPKQISRRAARALWPEANRKGLTAVQFHTELTRQGHAIAPDTARKWLTALRKTGTC